MISMILKPFLQELYDYSYWANRRYLKTAAALSEEQLKSKQGYSWDGIQDTFLHMMSSETVWLKRWQGEAPPRHLTASEFPTFASIPENWTDLEEKMRTFLEVQSDQSLHQDMTCIGFNGGAFHLPLYQMMLHVPNHNNHHRSELAAMYAGMNVPHPEDELVQYFLTMSGQRRE